MDIYTLKVSECKDALISLIPHLSPRRQKLFKSILIADSKLLSVASEAILAYALSLPLPCQYQTDSNGKPYISGQKHFNVSHSGDFVVCAVSDFEVGVDTEKIERMSPRLMYKFLSDEEISALDSLNDSDLPRHLCEKWVRKEAYLKLTGRGLRTSPASLTFEGDALKGDKSVFSRVLPLSDEQLIAVCSKKDTEINIIELCSRDIKGIQVN